MTRLLRWWRLRSTATYVFDPMPEVAGVATVFARLLLSNPWIGIHPESPNGRYGMWRRVR